MNTVEDALSSAEREVLEHLLDGLTNVQIVELLDRSDKTVKNHISHILERTGCVSRLELTVTVSKERLRILKRKLRVARR